MEDCRPAELTDEHDLFDRNSSTKDGDNNSNTNPISIDDTYIPQCERQVHGDENSLLFTTGITAETLKPNANDIDVLGIKMYAADDGMFQQDFEHDHDDREIASVLPLGVSSTSMGNIVKDISSVPNVMLDDESREIPSTTDTLSFITEESPSENIDHCAIDCNTEAFHPTTYSDLHDITKDTLERTEDLVESVCSAQDAFAVDNVANEYDETTSTKPSTYVDCLQQYQQAVPSSIDATKHDIVDSLDPIEAGGALDLTTVMFDVDDNDLTTMYQHDIMNKTLGQQFNTDIEGNNLQLHQIYQEHPDALPPETYRVNDCDTTTDEAFGFAKESCYATIILDSAEINESNGNDSDASMSKEGRETPQLDECGDLNETEHNLCSTESSLDNKISLNDQELLETEQESSSFTEIEFEQFEHHPTGDNYISRDDQEEIENIPNSPSSFTYEYANDTEGYVDDHLNEEYLSGNDVSMEAGYLHQQDGETAEDLAASFDIEAHEFINEEEKLDQERSQSLSNSFTTMTPKCVEATATEVHYGEEDSRQLLTHEESTWKAAVNSSMMMEEITFDEHDSDDNARRANDGSDEEIDLNIEDVTISRDRDITLPITYTAACDHLYSSSYIKSYQNSINPEELEQSSACFPCCRPARLQYPGAIEERDTIFCIAKCPVDMKNAIHYRMLQTIYKKFTGTTTDCARYGKHWQDIGFQGHDPIVDLRGIGLLALLQMLSLITEYPTFATYAYELSLDENYHFPFMCISISITLQALEALRNGKLYPVCNNYKSSLSAINNFYAAMWFNTIADWKEKMGTTTSFLHVLQSVTEAGMSRPYGMITEFKSHMEHIQDERKNTNFSPVIGQATEDAKIGLMQ